MSVSICTVNIGIKYSLYLKKGREKNKETQGNAFIANKSTTLCFLIFLVKTLSQNCTLPNLITWSKLKKKKKRHLSWSLIGLFWSILCLWFVYLKHFTCLSALCPRTETKAPEYTSEADSISVTVLTVNSARTETQLIKKWQNWSEQFHSSRNRRRVYKMSLKPGRERLTFCTLIHFRWANMLESRK